MIILRCQPNKPEVRQIPTVKSSKLSVLIVEA